MVVVGATLVVMAISLFVILEYYKLFFVAAAFAGTFTAAFVAGLTSSSDSDSDEDEDSKQ